MTSVEASPVHTILLSNCTSMYDGNIVNAKRMFETGEPQKATEFKDNVRVYGLCGKVCLRCEKS